jgi:hypothetical protein
MAIRIKTKTTLEMIESLSEKSTRDIKIWVQNLAILVVQSETNPIIFEPQLKQEIDRLELEALTYPAISPESSLSNLIFILTGAAKNNDPQVFYELAEIFGIDISKLIASFPRTILLDSIQTQDPKVNIRYFPEKHLEKARKSFTTALFNLPSNSNDYESCGDFIEIVLDLFTDFDRLYTDKLIHVTAQYMNNQQSLENFLKEIKPILMKKSRDYNRAINEFQIRQFIAPIRP